LSEEPATALRPHGLLLALLAVLLAATAFALEGHVGLDLNDEGFLWYGTIETARGHVPIRDFESYEPGRYYWGALWFWLLRDHGIVALRLSLSALEAIGISCGLLVLRRVIPEVALLLVAGVLFAFWVEPRFRVFEITLTLLAVLVGVRLLEQPTTRRHFESGVFIGLAAFFGRNHALYTGTAGALTAALALSRGQEPLPRRLGALVGGTLLGASPLLAMMLFVPGFFPAFLGSLDTNLKTGGNVARNLMVPGLNMPWPRGLWDLPKHFHLAVTLLALPVLYLAGALRLLGRRHKHWPVLASSTIVGTAYLHHIYSRADITHLASGIAPFFVMVLAFAPESPTWWRRCVATLLLLLGIHLSLNTILDHHPLYLLKTFRERYTKVRVGGDHLSVGKGTAFLIRTLKSLKEDLLRDGQVLIVPNMPGLYPVLQKEAPTRKLLFILPESSTVQYQLLASLEKNNVEWTIDCAFDFDGRAELGLRNAYPLLFEYLRNWTVRPERVPGCELRERPPKDTKPL
jgi:hypothetical protein